MPVVVLGGIYDVHMHAYPEFSDEVIVRMGNEEVARAARNAGMGGIILKSHFWPTTFMADVINKKFAAEEDNPNPAFRAIGSITLNASSGGIEPWAAEAAIKMDARIAKDNSSWLLNRIISRRTGTSPRRSSARSSANLSGSRA